jgi:amino acid adenylation domain-containing protein
VLNLWNQTEADYAQGSCVHQLFEEQVEKTPEAVAVVFEDEVLSYGELNRRANQLGHYLRELGVGADTRVGLYVERSVEMVVGVLGILKAGGAYLPLDPQNPLERSRFMLEEAGVAVLLTQQHLLASLPPCSKVISLDTDWEPISQRSESNPQVAMSADNLAYVMYTSGSTGTPKGVSVVHRNVVRLVKETNYAEFGPDEVFLQMAPMSFDASTLELWASLLNGGKLVVLSPQQPTLPELGAVLAQNQITTLWLTAGLFHLVVEEGLDQLRGVRQLLAGGDALSVKHVKQVLAGFSEEQRLINGYGPTENTTFSCCHVMGQHSEIDTTVPIGRAITNTQVYVLDQKHQQVPLGVAGELYLGGDGLARGYLNRPDLTAGKFIPHPFSAEGGARLYRTGDRVRYLESGDLEFLGRLDQQVKLRGFRIELEEIELQLAGLPGINTAVAVAREDEPGDKKLVAYMTLDENGHEVLDHDEVVASLRRTLQSRLPDYMVPSAFVILDTFPLTANGKLDRKALPAPDGEAYAVRGYEEPLGETETAIAKIWTELLKLERVGRHDNFFDLGGHSLLVMRMISQLRKALAVEVAIRDLFAHPVLADFARLIESAAQVTLPPITHCERSGPPLSFAQQRLWFLAQMGASQAYHLFYGWRLKGQLDRAALRQALDRIVARHEALRTTFVAVEDEPRQRIAAAVDSCFRLLEHDLSEQTDSQEALDRLIKQEVGGGFDLAAGPLIRGRLIRLGQDEYALLINMHHIVSDGWSESILMKELTVLYAAFVRGEGDPLPELEVQYADYAVWQRQWMEGEVLRQQAEYWRQQLVGAPALLELPTDHARPAEQDYTGGWVRVELEEELTRGLKELSKQHGMTLYMTLLAGWSALLGRLSGQAEVVIGTPVANRGQIETEGLIGFFVNMLALRIDVSGSGSVVELLQQVKEQVLAAQQHQDIPFEQVVEVVQPLRSLSHSPIFQVMFDWQQNVGRGGLTLPGLQLGPLGTDVSAVAKFDLTLSLLEVEGRIVGGLKYATALYDESTVARYLTYLRRMLRGMVAEQTRAIERLRILPENERRQLLYEWNATEAEYPRERCVQELIEEQVEKTPEAAAVVFEDQVLSYGALNRRANQLGHYLRELGVGPDARVALCVERGLEMMVGLLGILKAGGAYVPLDPAYPQERLQYMLADSAPVVLLTEAHLQGLFAAVSPALPVLELDGAAAPWSNHPETNPLPGSVGLTSQHLAYVIYTSGSTGAPKGVMIAHSALTNFLRYMQRRPGIAPEDVFLGTTTLSFDIAAVELYLPLMVGAQLRLLKREAVLDGHALVRQLTQGATLMQATPTSWQMLVESGWQATRGLKALCGGEALGTELARQLVERSGAAWNLYGPTETTVWSLVEELESAGGRVSIGKPIANTQVYILDQQREAAPVGVAGELYIGGDGVGRGYWQRAELTAERFVSDPFAKDHGARMYRTGDQARWLADGRVEFLGRIDHQVKVRGYRIELGEIEARLVEHEAVREAVVMAREEAAGDKRLVAYYTSVVSNGSSSEGAGAEELRRHLSARLPEYMVPAAYVHLEQLPLTPNGKLDRKALPAPDGEAYAVRGYEEPMGEKEKVIASIWTELLKLERVGRYDNFFELGGNSLLGMRLIQRMRRAELELDVRTLFATPVLFEMAATIRPPTGVADVEIPPNLIPPGCEAITPDMLPLVQLSAEEIDKIVRVVPGGAANIQDIYPLAPLQEGLLFHHLMGAEGDAYVVAAAYSFDNRERLDRYLEAMQAVIDRHDILRTGVIWEGLNEPLQVVWRKVTLPIEEAVLEAGAGDASRQLYTRYNPRSYRIDLRQAPPLRVVIAHDEEQGRWLMLKLLHHLAGDLTTSAIMHDEIQAYLLGQADRLPAPLPFRNLVARARLGVSQEEHEEFFRRMLGDVEEPTAPFGLLNVHGDGTGIESARMNVEAELARRIRERARKLGVSAAVLCHVAWALVVARASERDDVVFGTVLFGRMQGEEAADRAMGVFINTLPVRVGVGEVGVEKSVRGVHKQLAELLRHEHASLALAQRCSAVTAPTPLFSSLLNYLYGPAGAQAQPAEQARAWEGIEGLYGESRNNYPLNLAVTDLGEAFRLTAHVEPSIGANRVC